MGEPESWQESPPVPQELLQVPQEAQELVWQQPAGSSRRRPLRL